MTQPQENERRRTQGWLLDPQEREELLAAFVPKFANVVAHHVTLRSGTDTPLDVPRATRGDIVGRIDDHEGVEALIVEIDGSTERPGGGTYHITWSLDRSRGKQARDSNEVIARLGWQPLLIARPITLSPAYWERERSST